MQGKVIYNELDSKVTPLLCYPQQSCQFCDMVVEPTVNTGLHFVFANVTVSKSSHQIFFYPTKERVKRTEKDLF